MSLMWTLLSSKVSFVTWEKSQVRVSAVGLGLMVILVVQGASLGGWIWTGRWEGAAYGLPTIALSFVRFWIEHREP